MMIVCPLSVVGVWEEQWAEHSGIPYNLMILDRKTEEIQIVDPSLNILVVNYDLVWRRKEIVDAFAPQMVVADESHRIKKPSAKRSRFLRRLNDVPYRAILTGTPTPKSLVDYYGQWVFLNKDRFGTVKANFEDRYVIYGRFVNQIRGYRNIKELKRKVHSDASVVKKESCLDLPERTYQRVPLDLEDTAAKMYERMAYELFIELEDGEVVDAKTVGTKLLKLQQITGGFIFTEGGNPRQVSEAKLSILRDLLEDYYGAGRKVVVFARFLPEIAAISHLGRKLGFITMVLSGSTRREDRDSQRRSFQQDPGPALFVAQIQTGGLGISLHAAHDAIFYSVTYALDDYIQACDRLHRIGQTNHVTYRHLVARRTVDLDIYECLRRKQDITELILQNPSTLTQELRDA